MKLRLNNKKISRFFKNILLLLSLITLVFLVFFILRIPIIFEHSESIFFKNLTIDNYKKIYGMYSTVLIVIAIVWLLVVIFFMSRLITIRNDVPRSKRYKQNYIIALFFCFLIGFIWVGSSPINVIRDTLDTSSITKVSGICHRYSYSIKSTRYSKDRLEYRVSADKVNYFTSKEELYKKCTKNSLVEITYLKNTKRVIEIVVK